MSKRSDSAPDSAQPLLGWRVWALDMNGGLNPLVAGSGAWQRGLNEARCHLPATRHRAPAKGCVCGFNALHRPPVEFTDDKGHALGVVAGWGEVDVYGTGWRSQYASVLAIYRDGEPGRLHRVKLEAAAERYGVPLLDMEELEAHALRYAAPADSAVLPNQTPPRPARRRRRRAKQSGPAPASGPAPKPQPRPALPPARVFPSAPLPARALPAEFTGQGVVVAHHLAVAHDRNFLAAGPTPALAALAGDRVEPAAVEGTRLSVGSPLLVARIVPGRCEIVLPSPVAGKLTRINPAPVPEFARGPGREGWLVEVHLDGASPDESGVAWGRGGAEAYRESVLATGSDADLLMRSAPNPVPAAGLVSGEELTGWLRAFAQGLDAAITRAPGLTPRLAELGRTVSFRVTGIEEELRIEPPSQGGPGGGPAARWVRTVRPGGAGGSVAIDCMPQALQSYWRGEIGLDPDHVSSGSPGDEDPASRSALHLRSGTRGDLLLVNSLHGRVFAEAGKVLDSLGDPWFRAGDATRDPVANLRALAGFEPPDLSAGAA